MMIIKKKKKRRIRILYLKRVKQLVTTYPPLGSGSNSKTKKNGHGHRYKFGPWYQTLRHFRNSRINGRAHVKRLLISLFQNETVDRKKEAL